MIKMQGDVRNPCVIENSLAEMADRHLTKIKATGE
jgi:hypothetical protein